MPVAISDSDLKNLALTALVVKSRLAELRKNPSCQTFNSKQNEQAGQNLEFQRGTCQTMGDNCVQIGKNKSICQSSKKFPKSKNANTAKWKEVADKVNATKVPVGVKLGALLQVLIERVEVMRKEVCGTNRDLYHNSSNDTRKMMSQVMCGVGDEGDEVVESPTAWEALGNMLPPHEGGEEEEEGDDEVVGSPVTAWEALGSMLPPHEGAEEEGDDVDEDEVVESPTAWEALGNMLPPHEGGEEEGDDVDVDEVVESPTAWEALGNMLPPHEGGEEDEGDDVDEATDDEGDDEVVGSHAAQLFAAVRDFKRQQGASSTDDAYPTANQLLLSSNF